MGVFYRCFVVWPYGFCKEQQCVKSKQLTYTVVVLTDRTRNSRLLPTAAQLKAGIRFGGNCSGRFCFWVFQLRWCGNFATALGVETPDLRKPETTESSTFPLVPDLCGQPKLKNFKNAVFLAWFFYSSSSPDMRMISWENSFEKLGC